jgi:hypothetical protein
MLIDIESGKTIDRVPFQSDFDTLRARLSDTDFDVMGRNWSAAATSSMAPCFPS